MNFKEELETRVQEAERIVLEYLPKEEGYTATLAKAMNYSLSAGGKRLRPVLLAETYRVFGGSGKTAEPFMAGMEMIHTHSLVHDDLPALDNDDLRRGKPTTHKAFGEAMAVLAGDALLNLAYETMASAFSLSGDPVRPARALAWIAGKTGINGMLGGQCVDVENEGCRIDGQMRDFLYEKKTSALLEAAMGAGAILAGAGEAELKTVEQAASRLGIAFQIVDDILDVVGEEKALGKPIHSDEKNEKSTYVAAFGIEKARQEVDRLSGETVSLLKSLGRDTAFLESYVMWLRGRSM